MTLSVLLGNPTILFALLLIAGETALIPAVYFAHIGAVDFFYIIPLTLVATVIVDTILYLSGCCIERDALISHKFVCKHSAKIEKFSSYFTRHSIKFLLISKFIYGTRMVAQILCGVHRIGFLKYTFFNIIGVLMLLVFLVGLAPLVTSSVEAMTDTVYTVQISFSVFIIISFGIFFLLKYFTLKKLTE